MTATREHLAGLELAFKQVNSDGGFDEESLLRLIAEAQSTPEPVQGEAVACWIKSSVPGADIVVLGNPADIHQAATDTKIPLYTSAAKPDAELVELLRSKFPRIDPCQPVPLDEKAHCCEYTIYVERERLHRIIDAKMASLEVKP